MKASFVRFVEFIFKICFRSNKKAKVVRSQEYFLYINGAVDVSRLHVSQEFNCKIDNKTDLVIFISPCLEKFNLNWIYLYKFY